MNEKHPKTNFNAVLTGLADKFYSVSKISYSFSNLNNSFFNLFSFFKCFLLDLHLEKKFLSSFDRESDDYLTTST